MTLPLQAGPLLPPEARRRIRERAIFECHKWDPQIEDQSILAPFSLTLAPEAWEDLARLASALAAETAAAEAEILRRPELMAKLGLPWRARRFLAKATPQRDAPRHPRVDRYDFHFTPEGWKISEVNSDVPGGYIESGGLARLYADEDDGRPAPLLCPASILAGKLRQRLPGPSPRVALVHATAYSDDRQVMEYLAAKFELEGLRPLLAGPNQLVWREGLPFPANEPAAEPFDAAFRFFPGEWLLNLGGPAAWGPWFHGARVPLANPATALLTQSKRFPLVWEHLKTPLPTWRALLPETVDPRRADWARRPQDWVLKPVFGRVGDSIGMEGVTPGKELRSIRRWARWWPSDWVAQRRFLTEPIPSPIGPLHPCLGVYVVDGTAAGIYCRLGASPLVNHLALEAPVFLGAPSRAQAANPLPQLTEAHA